VIPDIGLAIRIHDILEVGKGHVYPSDGSAHVKVKFRLVVFRPFVGQILIGTIKACSVEGIQVSMKFFDHIYIPPDALQEQSKFDENEELWYWDYEGSYQLLMDINDKIRFRVESILFNPPSNTRKIKHKQKMKEMAEKRGLKVEEVPDEKEVILSPLVIIGSVCEDGLGILSWWIDNKIQGIIEEKNNDEEVDNSGSSENNEDSQKN